MCSWVINNVVDHFLRKGTNVYGAAMDMSKAFDLVEWCELYMKMIERNVEPVFLQILLFIYRNQQCEVK